MPTVERSGPVPDTNEVVAHYDDAYFDFQRRIGEFGGWALTPLFTPFIKETDNVLDFGCGGGYILKNVRCADRMGIEVNEAARAVALAVNGIRTVQSVAQVPDEWADVVISNHALEHCTAPFVELVALLPKLRPGGRFVCFVPHESIGNQWHPGSVDNHLYTWNPMTLGNLFGGAGYAVESVGGFYHVWPPFHQTLAKGGRRIFNLFSRIYGTLRRSNSQVRIVARRPAASRSNSPS